MTTAVPTVTPPAPVMVTVAPGSPVPVTDVPSAAIVAVGAAGATTSGVVTLVGGETLPLGSVWVTVSVPPSDTPGASGTV